MYVPQILAAAGLLFMVATSTVYSSEFRSYDLPSQQIYKQRQEILTLPPASKPVPQQTIPARPSQTPSDAPSDVYKNFRGIISILTPEQRSTLEKKYKEKLLGFIEQKEWENVRHYSELLRILSEFDMRQEGE